MWTDVAWCGVDEKETVPVNIGGFTPGLLFSDTYDHSSFPKGQTDSDQLSLEGQKGDSMLDGVSLAARMRLLSDEKKPPCLVSLHLSFPVYL